MGEGEEEREGLAGRPLGGGAAEGTERNEEQTDGGGHLMGRKARTPSQDQEEKYGAIAEWEKPTPLTCLQLIPRGASSTHPPISNPLFHSVAPTGFIQ